MVCSDRFFLFGYAFVLLLVPLPAVFLTMIVKRERYCFPGHNFLTDRDCCETFAVEIEKYLTLTISTTPHRTCKNTVKCNGLYKVLRVLTKKEIHSMYVHYLP